jgi:uncharacterized protein YutE (UPF0331/DUF86 family)
VGILESGWRAVTRVNKEVIKRLINEAEEALDEIKKILAVDLSSFVNNRSLRFSLRYSIVMVVEALADLAVAILEKDFGVAVESYRDAFLRLAEKGVINAEIARSMVRLAGLRNIIVHRYWSVDDMSIYNDARRSGVEAVERFIEEVLGYVETKDP